VLLNKEKTALFNKSEPLSLSDNEKFPFVRQYYQKKEKPNKALTFSLENARQK
jgi:hypothetical protein